MFNVTIINAKGSIKKIAILIVTLILLFIVTRFIQNLKSTEVFKINLSSKLVNCLNNEIPAINEIVSKSNTTIKEENEEDTKDFSERILGVELSRLKESEKIEENPVETPGENIENKPVEEEKDNNNSNVDVSNILENVETQIVTKNPISESFNNEINGGRAAWPAHTGLHTITSLYSSSGLAVSKGFRGFVDSFMASMPLRR